MPIWNQTVTNIVSSLLPRYSLCMKKRLLICVAVAAAIFSSAQAVSEEGVKYFIHARGRELVTGPGDAAIQLSGVGFSNYAWQDSISETHHDEKDFVRVRDMNMNAIRLYLNAKHFEGKPYSYRKSAWEWLDKNIAWAKKHGIYLIPAMVYPQGGWADERFFGDPENLKRLTALWKAIAARYKDEPAIAGFDLLNEPVAADSADVYYTYVAELVREIRKFDKNHLLIVEKLQGVRGKRETWGKANYPKMDDKNVMYSFHFYWPQRYTHQFYKNTQEGGRYPDETVVEEGNLRRDKFALEMVMNRFTEFGKRNNVPIYVGEFGLFKQCFIYPKGGLGWAGDMVDLMKAAGLSFTWHAYHEEAFGIYTNPGLPDEGFSNKALMELFRKKLAPEKKPASSP
jgi:hypothetical protein